MNASYNIVIVVSVIAVLWIVVAYLKILLDGDEEFPLDDQRDIPLGESDEEEGHQDDPDR